MLLLFNFQKSNVLDIISLWIDVWNQKIKFYDKNKDDK